MSMDIPLAQHGSSVELMARGPLSRSEPPSRDGAEVQRAFVGISEMRTCTSHLVGTGSATDHNSSFPSAAALVIAMKKSRDSSSLTTPSLLGKPSQVRDEGSE